MQRKIINWIWEDKNAQESFIKWQGMPDETETKSEVRYIEKLVSIKPPLKILDIGCGTGRHAIEFYKRGYIVDGIDVAENYLNIALERAKREDLDIKFELMRGSDLQEKENILPMLTIIPSDL
jgi:2-polyprenyl-3-methyl-5-hydroxy-6-metoxy-1,4-benzoquinol methylase